MKIRYKDKWDENEKELCVVEFILSRLNWTQYDGGAVEDARQIAENNSEALAMLILLLCEKKVISAKELTKKVLEKSCEYADFIVEQPLTEP